METWKHTSGMWSLVAIAAEMDLNLRKIARMKAWWGRRFARVEALAMTASAVRICSRKKGKANGPSELEKILLGYYIRLGPGSQESCVYLETKRLRRYKRIDKNFGIKSFLSQNWGACVYTKIWRRTRELEASRIVSIKDSIAWRFDISWFRGGTGIGSLWMTSADNDDGLWLASGNTYRSLQKGKD